MQSLGRVLALWETCQNEAGIKEKLHVLSETEQALLTHLRERLVNLNSPDQNTAPPPNPKNSNAETSYSNKIVELMLTHLFLNGDAASTDEDKFDQLCQDLNNDLAYFERFSDAMRSYYHNSREFAEL